MLVPRANLRAFEPLEAFPPRERERFRAYVSTGSGITRGEAADAEDTVAVRLLTGVAGYGPSHAALVRRAGRRLLLCPLQLELRAGTALRALRAQVPAEVADAFVPDPRARDRLAYVIADGAAPHILDACWAVPLHWFVAFAPTERHLTDPPEGRGPHLTYLTHAALAADRLARAIDIVESTLEDGEDVLAALADIAAWVDSFDAGALLELDYGRVGDLFNPLELARDRTCEDLWNALEALGAGDLLGAAAYYGAARSRWGTMASKQHAS